MPNPLDYEAQVPINTRAPFSVNVDPNKPPGDRFKDYVPNKAVSPVVVKAEDSVRKKNFMRPPTARYEQDYISPEDSAVKRNNEKERIKILAKELYEAEKPRRDAYEAAAKLIESTEPGKTSPEFERAQKIIMRGAPMTKTDAMEKAARQFYGLRS